MHKLILLLVFLKFTCNPQENVKAIDLLKKDSLSLFDVKGGTAEYTVSDGVLTGVADKDIPNTFLTTKKKYDNFALSFSVKVDPRLNSGVQIRSQYDMDKSGYEMLKGYQVEIDPSERAWSGGIYEERGRGWIGNLSANPEGKKAFKNNEWNNYYIEAIDNQVRVWVNGINTVNLLDSLGTEGYIGFQVHSIYDDAHVGAKVQWKDIMLYPNPSSPKQVSQDQLAPEINLLVNQLSDAEKAAGWKLFGIQNVSVPFDLSPWRLDGNCLCGEGKNMSELPIADLKTDFEIKFEYSIAKAGSATFAYEQNKHGNDDLIFVIADDGHLDDDVRDEEKAGSILGKVAATNLSNPDRDKAMRFHDQWSQVHIEVERNRIKHWLNNNLVVDAGLMRDDAKKRTRNLHFRTADDRICVRSIKYLAK